MPRGVYPRTIKPVAHRMMARVEVAANGCWVWQGARLDTGYGIIGLAPGGRLTDQVHRVSYSLFIGPIPEGLHVCHRCDNPPCCNPFHLFVGTRADNMADAARKGRMLSGKNWKKIHDFVGAKNGQAKLTERQVLEIRSLAMALPQKTIAARYGVTASTISSIVRRINWPHI